MPLVYSIHHSTFGCYVKFPEHGDKVFVVTCQRVSFHLNESENKLYHPNNTSQLRRSVLFPENRYLEMMMKRAVKGAQDQQLILHRQQRGLGALAGQESRDAKRSRRPD